MSSYVIYTRTQTNGHVERDKQTTLSGVVSNNVLLQTDRYWL